MGHHDQAQRADDERSGVESERGRGSARGDDDAPDGGAEERRPDGLARAVEGVALDKEASTYARVLAWLLMRSASSAIAIV
jgi:hypothetical protein